MEADSLQSLMKRVRNLEDVEEICRLRMRYHVYINEGHVDRIQDLYTADAIVDMGSVGKATGTAEIDALFRRIPQNLQLVVQFIHNHMVDLDGDEATGLAYIDARYARNGESVIVAGSFRERYRRTAEGWRISEMILRLFFSVPLQVGWAGAQLNYVEPLR